MFLPLMQQLSHHYPILAPDTPGFGQSFRPTQPHTIPFYAHTIYEALQQLGITHCNLFGHHTGAAIAIQLAFDYPQLVRRLILVGPPLLTSAQIAALQQTIRPIVPDADGRFLHHTWQRLQQKSPHLPLTELMREFILTLQAGDSYPQAYTAVFQQPIAEQLPTITCPTLLIAGENDSLRASLEPALALLPNGRMHTIPHADSYLCDTHAPQLAQLIHPFLTEQEND
jgi:pimeloyl-ACP methyl ester carboxylesterase